MSANMPCGQTCSLCFKKDKETTFSWPTIGGKGWGPENQWEGAEILKSAWSEFKREKRKIRDRAYR